MPRTLEKNGVNLAFKVLPELHAKLGMESLRQTRRRGVGGAELRGPAYTLNSLICYFLNLPRADREEVVNADRLILENLFDMTEEDAMEVSVSARDVDPRTMPLVEPGLSVGSGHVHDVDPKGQDEPTKRRRTPKRRS